jgi:AraC-like DNA-binding protein
MATSFQLIDIVILIGICQGVFLALTLQRITNNNRSANTYLSALIILATIMLMGRFVYFRFLSNWVFQWSLLVDSLVFLFGPFIYMYVRRLLFKGNTSYKLPFYHFIPFFGMVLFAGYYIVFYSPTAYLDFFINGNLLFYFRIISLIMIAYNSLYLLKSFQLLKKFRKEEKEAFSFQQSPLTYLNFFLFSVTACLFTWAISFLNAVLFNDEISFVNYESIWVAIPVFIYVIGYFSLKQPELFRIPFEEKSTEKKARLTESEAIVLKQKLDSLMQNERVFLDSNLTLRDVSETLQTSTNNISWLLNNVYKTTFYDFINGYRVEEFIEKIKNNEHLTHTILALSMDVGFNSKSTFNKAFKITMNETPSNYIKKHRAA